jgi:RimJ/RimL family protein N-acetyltransferase
MDQQSTFRQSNNRITLQKINAYGIELIPLQKSDLELVRNWRNAPEIAMYMEYKNHISMEQQQVWYKNIVDQQDYYFVIALSDKKIGVIHINLFDETRTTAHVGLYIADSMIIGTGLALKASLALLDFAFYTLNLHTVYAKTHQENTQALAYNLFLGFEKFDVNSNHFVLLKLEKAAYEQKRVSLQKLAQP